MSVPQSAASASKSRFDTRTLVTLAMLTAFAYVAMLVCKIIPPVGGFLSFDLKDTVIAIAGFIFGPLSALCISVVVALLEFLTVSDTGPIGLLMNVIATISFVCPAVYIYRRNHKVANAVVGLTVGVICLTLVMLLWNYIMTPIFYNMQREAVVEMFLPLLIPFNVVKGVVNSALIMLLYTPVVRALRKARLVPQSQHRTGDLKPKFNWGPTIVSFLVLITGVLLALSLMRIL